MSTPILSVAASSTSPSRRCGVAGRLYIVTLATEGSLRHFCRWHSLVLSIVALGGSSAGGVLEGRGAIAGFFALQAKRGVSIDPYPHPLLHCFTPQPCFISLPSGVRTGGWEDREVLGLDHAVRTSIVLHLICSHFRDKRIISTFFSPQPSYPALAISQGAPVGRWRLGPSASRSLSSVRLPAPAENLLSAKFTPISPPL